MWSNLRSFSVLSVLVTSFQCVHTAPAPADDALTVDLGYALYKPNVVNKTTGYATFLNIRYAAPPIGERRWAPPAPPLNARDQGVVQGSNAPTICPQANPAWVEPAVNALGDDAIYTIPPGLPPSPVSEDCLYLDVRTPTRALDDACKRKPAKAKPVMVFIHGGGFVVGVKGKYDPTELLAQGRSDVVYVAFLYRLGAFGWLTDPDDPSAIVPNLGLLDQRAALKWVQDNIAKFGGDPSQVTIFGESAGGGSVLLHSTAYGGTKEQNLFKRGIPQSPYIVNITKAQQKQTKDSFLAKLNVTTVAEAKKLSTEALQKANTEVIAPSAYGEYTFGPTIDGDLVPELPSKLYLEGRFNRDISMMSGYNSDEGRLFVNQSLSTEDDYATYLRGFYPFATPDQISYIQNTLYPPLSSNTPNLPYTTFQQRLGLTFADAFLNCQAYAADRAYISRAYEYVFAVPPGYHFQDISYTFFTLPTPPGVDAGIAAAFQKYLTQFAKQGDPNAKGLPPFPSFGENGESLVIDRGVGGIVARKVRDEAAVRRCEFWLSGEVFGA
ncbi:MAG: hypothetical protein M1817_002601 [Caeruleum heppii]|nr:MAG: hypothetical protein M1817_002601 [Caeruleum heppii]